jgi:hypothetical protein
MWILSFKNSGMAHTGAAEDTGHLDELNGGLAGIHLVGRERALSSRVGVGLDGSKGMLKMNLPCVGSVQITRGLRAGHLSRQAADESS